MDQESKDNLIDNLFKAGTHYGFSRSRRHPSVKPYLFGGKDGNDLIDIRKTADSLLVAKSIVSQIAVEPEKQVLYVCTKEEVAPLIKKQASRVGFAYVSNRWIGGTITNFPEIKKRLDRLESLLKEREAGDLQRKYTKKEMVLINREVEKLEFNFSGIRSLKDKPALMVVVDPKFNHIAVTEAKMSDIPVIGIMSSDNDLKSVDYPIVVNDSLQSSVDFILSELTDTYISAKLIGKDSSIPAEEVSKVANSV